MPPWIINKIITFLSTNEGLSLDTTTPNKILVTDVFGFKYEITINSLGRSQLWREEKPERLTKENLSQIKALATQKLIRKM